MSQIHELLDTLNARIAAYRNLPSGTTDLGLALASGRVVHDAEALLKALNLQAGIFAADPDDDDERSERVAVTVQGVVLTVQQVCGSLIVHVSDKGREDADSTPLALCVETDAESFDRHF